MSYIPEYLRINWENYSSTATPLNAANLNKMDAAIAKHDGELQRQDIVKANKSDFIHAVTEVAYDDKTGVLDFTLADGNHYIIDLNIEKIPAKLELDVNGILRMITDDGSVYTCDLSKLIHEYKFESSSTIIFQEQNGTVTASIPNGSITDEKLEANYLASIREAEASAISAKNEAGASAVGAMYDSLKSEGYAVGEQNGVPVTPESPYYQNNAKYYCEHSSGGSGTSDYKALTNKPMINGHELTGGLFEDNTSADLKLTDSRYFNMYQNLGYLERHPITLLNPSDTFWIDVPEGAETMYVFGNNVVESGNRFFTVVKKSKSGLMDYTQMSNIPAQIYVKGYAQIGITEVNRMDIVNYYAFNKTDKLTSTTSTSPIVAKGNIRSLKMIGSSRKSKNLIVPRIENGTSNGITFQHTDDYKWKVFGTSTARAYFYISRTGATSQTINLADGDYILSCKGLKTEKVEVTLSKYKGLTWKGQEIITSTSGNEVRFSVDNNVASEFGVFIDIREANVTINETLEIMLRKADGTDITYEPYGIISASGDVVSCSENLCERNEITNTNNYRGIFDGKYATELMTYSFKSTKSLDGQKIYLILDNANKGVVGTSAYSNGRNVASVTLTESQLNDVRNASVCVLSLYDTTSQATDMSEVQIQNGSLTDYTPYGHSIVHTDRPLLSVNTLKNELIVNADGSGTFVERVKEVDLGGLTWATNSASSGVRFKSTELSATIRKNVNSSTIPQYVINDKYDAITPNDTYNLIKGISIDSAGSILIYDSAYTDASAFKTSLNGSKLIYELATPQTYQLSPKEVAELLSLKTYGKTYIECDTEYEIGYFLENDIASPIADVDSKVDEVASQLSVVKSDVDKLKADYSTNEVDTGIKWIDGKPIYRRVYPITTSDFVFSQSSSRYSGVYTLPNSASIDEVIRVDGWFIASNSANVRVQLNQTMPTSALQVSACSNLVKANGNYDLEIQGDQYYGKPRSAMLIFEYTKA